jgi:rhamnosyl/mannosyltransferase
LTEKSGLEGRVFFLGFISDVELAGYYHACDLFCLPSVAKSEAFGIVQLEAMACGKPVVSTEVGTATSVVNVHGKTGLVVPPRDERALSDALNRLIEDRSLAEEMGRNAKEHVRKRYDNDIAAERVYKLYRDILDRPGRLAVDG